MCLQHILLLSQLISYYNSNRSNLYIVLLDATKAFDSVDYCKLFRKLIDRNIWPSVLRLLIYMYTNQSLWLKLWNHFSDMFNAQNGVKQGEILSPILFAFYMDGLFARLGDSGFGHHIGHHFVGGS